MPPFDVWEYGLPLFMLVYQLLQLSCVTYVTQFLSSGTVEYVAMLWIFKVNCTESNSIVMHITLWQPLHYSLSISQLITHNKQFVLSSLVM